MIIIIFSTHCPVGGKKGIYQDMNVGFLACWKHIKTYRPAKIILIFLCLPAFRVNVLNPGVFLLLSIKVFNIRFFLGHFRIGVSRVETF